jgi:hypothetical protein
MKWLNKYFNKKVTNEDLFLNHLKSTYDFDEACIIKKDNPDFLTIIKIIASSVVDKNNKPLGITTPDPSVVEKLIQKIQSECEYSIIKFSRNYTMSKDHHYVLFSTNVNGYSIPFKYLTDINLFGEFPYFNSFEHEKNLKKIKNYRFINNNPRLIPSYSIRIPLKADGRLANYTDFFYTGSDSCYRDVEVIIDVHELDDQTHYCIQLFYGITLLKEGTVSDLLNFSLFLDDFLFPYNLTENIINEVGIPLPLEFTPEFVKYMNKDFKLTIDMLKI